MTDQRENRHSPAPWRAYVTDEGDLVVDLGDHFETYVRYLDFGDMEVTNGTDHWTAALIAATPELYAALKRIVEVHEGPGETDAPMMIAARAALAKAETFPS